MPHSYITAEKVRGKSMFCQESSIYVNSGVTHFQKIEQRTSHSPTLYMHVNKNTRSEYIMRISLNWECFQNHPKLTKGNYSSWGDFVTWTPNPFQKIYSYHDFSHILLKTPWVYCSIEYSLLQHMLVFTQTG